MDVSDAPAIIEHATYSLSFTPAACAWLPGSAAFATAGASTRGGGALRVLELRAGSGVNGSGSSGNAAPLTLAAAADTSTGLRCLSFGAAGGGSALAAGDASGLLCMWDVRRLGSSSNSKSGSGDGIVAANSTTTTMTPPMPPKPLFSAAAHTGMVNALDGVGACSGSAPELATGGRDGCARVWDVRVPSAVATFAPAPCAAVRECWAVAFGGSVGAERALATGYDNGDVKIFDLRAPGAAPLWEANAGNGVTALDFNRKSSSLDRLIATTLEANFRVYDVRAAAATSSGAARGRSDGSGGGGSAAIAERAHKATVWVARHAPHNRDVWATVGGNGGINLYRFVHPAAGGQATDGGGGGVGGGCRKSSSASGRVELLNARIIAPQPIAAFDWHADRAGLACVVALDQTARVLLITKLDRV